MRTPDERLHRRLARGEEAALGELYDRFAPLVHGLATRILDDQEAAEQLTREVFADLWTRPEAYRPTEGTLRAWLAALTHRHAVERLRRRAGAVRGPERSFSDRATHHAAALPGQAGRAPAGGEDGEYREPARRPVADERPVTRLARLGLRLAAAETACEGRHGRPQTVAAAGVGRLAP